MSRIFLDFCDNGLTDVPDQARKEGLAALDLSCNKLHQLGSQSIAPGALVELNLSSNKFSNTPSIVPSFTALTKLLMASNTIQNLGSALTSLTNLSHLELARNKLDDVSVVLGWLTALTHLDLSNNLLREAPVATQTLKCLKHLDISSNRISYLHKNIGHYSSLVRLKVAKNQLRTYPSSLCNCKSLEHLDLSNNSIVALQGRIYEWTSLRHLDLRNNKLTVLPSAVGWLDVETLRIEGNPNMRIPSQVTSVPEAQMVRAILTYQQIVCEQHRLIENHLGRFSVRAGDEIPNGFLKADPCRAFSARRRRDEDYTARNTSTDALTRAHMHGLLDLRCCGIPALPAKLAASFATRPIRVIDARYNSLHTAVPAAPLESLLILNLAHNELETVVDGRGHKWSQLAVLNVSFNALRSLPSSLGTAKRLQQLYVANNQLETLPDSLGTLPLVDLFLSENALRRRSLSALGSEEPLQSSFLVDLFYRTLPSCICNMTALCKLSIACNNLTTLPPALASVTTLQFLDVSFNSLTSLPPTLAHLSQLEAFNAAFNPLGFPPKDATISGAQKTKGNKPSKQPKSLPGDALQSGDLPPVVLEIHSLRELNLDHTGCCNIDHRLGALINLKALQMEGNDLQQPWLSLYEADPILLVYLHSPTLDSLDISECGLKDLPASMAAMHSLKILNISHNALTTLPRVLGELPALEALCVDGNPLAPHLAAMLEQGKARGPGQGEGAIMALVSADRPALDLAGLSLTSLPTEVFWHSGCLTHLDLQSNELYDLPESLSSCKSLQQITLDNNKLLYIPDVVFRLHALRVLQVSHNSISNVPENITKIRQLAMLTLGDNRLNGLPDCLSRFNHLVGLSVPNNRLSAFPPTLCSLSALSVLDLSGNRLVTLPDDLTNLTSLKSLRISSNNLVAVPPGLKALQDLANLSIRANPVSDGVAEPHARSRADVLKLLRELKGRAQNGAVAAAAGTERVTKRQSDNEEDEDSDDAKPNASMKSVDPPEHDIGSGNLVAPSAASAAQSAPKQAETKTVGKFRSPVPTIPTAQCTGHPGIPSAVGGPVAMAPDVLEAALGITSVVSAAISGTIGNADPDAGASTGPDAHSRVKKHKQKSGNPKPETHPSTSATGPDTSVVKSQQVSPAAKNATGQEFQADPASPTKKQKKPADKAASAKPPVSPAPTTHTPAPGTTAPNPGKDHKGETPADHTELATVGTMDHEALFSRLLSTQPTASLPQQQQPTQHAKGASQPTTASAQQNQAGQDAQQTMPAPAASKTAQSVAQMQEQHVPPVAAPAVVSSQQNQQQSSKQPRQEVDIHSKPGREQNDSPSQQPCEQSKKSAQLQSPASPVITPCEQEVSTPSRPSQPESRSPLGGKAPRAGPKDGEMLPTHDVGSAQRDENNFVQPADQTSRSRRGSSVPADRKRKDSAGQQPGPLSQLHSTWGLRASVSQSPVHHAVAFHDGGTQASNAGGVTLTRLRTPLSAARHDKRHQRWLDMGERLSVHPLPLQEQAPERQLSPEGILNSLKRALEPPQLPSPATDAPEATKRGRSVPAASDAGPLSTQQRPNSRKRFERVMASQISTLNRLIMSATTAGEPPASHGQDPDGS